MSVIALELDRTTQERLEKSAAALHRPMEQVAQEALSAFFENEEKLEQFRLDTLASLEDYQSTGLHLTGDEVNAWLERRARGERVPLPKCHA